MSDMTIGELARTIDAFRQGVREDLAALSARLDQVVLREVYASDRAALDARVLRLEDELRSARQATRQAFYAAIGSAGVALLMLLITLALRPKGAA